VLATIIIDTSRNVITVLKVKENSSVEIK